MCTITLHAYDRAKERLGLSKDAFARLACKALDQGVKSTVLKGRCRRYVDKIVHQHPHNNIKIYGEIMYVCAGQTVITVYQVPAEFKKYTNKLQNKSHETNSAQHPRLSNRRAA